CEQWAGVHPHSVPRRGPPAGHREIMSQDKPPDPPAPLMTTATRLSRETVERILGRLGGPDRQKLAFVWADRALRVHAPKALEAGGMAAEAAALKGLPQVQDEASARAALEAAKGPLQKAEAAR